MFGKARNTLGYNRKWAEFQPNNLRECSGIVLRRKGDTRCEEFDTRVVRKSREQFV